MLKYIGSNIKKARRQAGLTQEKLAERIDVSVSCMSRWETGRSTIGIPTLIAISKELNIFAGDLLREPSDTDVPSSNPQILRDPGVTYGNPLPQTPPVDMEFQRLISNLSDNEKEFVKDMLRKYILCKKKEKKTK